MHTGCLGIRFGLTRIPVASPDATSAGIMSPHTGLQDQPLISLVLIVRDEATAVARLLTEQATLYD